MRKKRCFLLMVCLCVLFSGCAGNTASVKLPVPAPAMLCGSAADWEGFSPANIGQTNEEVSESEEDALSQSLIQEFSPVELLLQNPELPNGCEVTSLAMLLTSAGFPADKVELYEECLPTRDFTYSGNQRFGPSPEEAYAGDASSSTGGWYCLEGPIIEAGNAWIEEHGGGGRMLSLTGISQSQLDRYAQDGTPVAVWVTIDYEPPVYADSFSWILPNGELYIPYDNLHCVVLAGEENGQYRIADPINGWQLVDKDAFWNSFDAMGRRAVTVQLDGYSTLSNALTQ
mgnify:FL=1